MFPQTVPVVLCHVAESRGSGLLLALAVWIPLSHCYPPHTFLPARNPLVTPCRSPTPALLNMGAGGLPLITQNINIKLQYLKGTQSLNTRGLMITEKRRKRKKYHPHKHIHAHTHIRANRHTHTLGRGHGRSRSKTPRVKVPQGRVPAGCVRQGPAQAHPATGPAGTAAGSVGQTLTRFRHSRSPCLPVSVPRAPEAAAPHWDSAS